jgi:excisionase family DNA binding protein
MTSLEDKIQFLQPTPPTTFDAVAGTRSSLTANALLTAEDVGQRWQVNPTQVYRLARDGTIPSVRLGKYVRFRRDAIEAFELSSTNTLDISRGRA